MYVNDFSNGWKKAARGSHVEKFDGTCRSWRINIIFLTMRIWDVLNVNANRTKLFLRSVDNFRITDFCWSN